MGYTFRDERVKREREKRRKKEKRKEEKMKEWEKKRGNVRKEDSTGMETKNSFFLINSGRIKRRENHSLEHEQKRKKREMKRAENSE